MIAFDYTHATAAVVGGRGVEPARLGPRIADGIAALERLHRRPATSFVALPEAGRAAVVAGARADAAWATDVVVLGIGGSSLGARAVYEALVTPLQRTWRDGSPRPFPRLHFVENVDPIETRDLLSGLPLETTIVNVVTKSGGTVETMAAFFLARQLLIDRFGEEGYRRRVVATTDPLSGLLRRIADDENLRTYDVPPGVGGRFSVLSAVGLYPLAAAGVDIDAMMAGAAAARDAALSRDLAANPAATFAAVQVALYEAGIPDVVFMPYASGLRALAGWFVQLWAESLGKLRGGEPVGPTPIVAIGATDQHAQLQLFMEGPPAKNIVFVDIACDDDDLEVPSPPPAARDALGHIAGRGLHEIRAAELAGVRAALAEVGRPTTTLTLSSVSAAPLGALLMTLECATGIAGALLGVDPYDQPGVELAKRFAHGILGREADAEFKARLERSVRDVAPARAELAPPAASAP